MALKYRLNTLGWYNFEMLVQILLKKIIGPGVISFGGYKDGGRDAAFVGKASFPSKKTKWKGNWVFQVKYSEIESKSATAQGNRIIRGFKKEIELIKKRRGIWPNNYILITNVRFTNVTRDKLYSLVLDAGFQGNFHTIDGREVCEFLDIYPEIRKSFPQLIGLADIEKIINKDLYNRSEAFVSQWQPNLSTFVAVSQYIKALDIIRKHHFVVLDGPPETGKSFMGAAITLYYACEAFEIFYIQKPEEIFRAYNAENKQLYFADDAVGTIRFDPNLGNYWSRELPGVLRKLDIHHKLIWTSRSYILQEATSKTKLREHIDNFPGIHEVLVEVGDFTEFEKALMLYNHVKNSKLPKSARELIKAQAKFVCMHPNFTPERIRQLVQIILPEIKEELTKNEKREWSTRITDFLENPSERFQRAYESLGASEKIMLLCLLDLGSWVKESGLKKEYEKRVSTI